MTDQLELDSTQLKALDVEIDRFLPEVKLANFRLDEVVIHLMFLAEVGEKTHEIQELDPGALDVAMGWAYSFCKPANIKKLRLEFDSDIFQFAKNLYHSARNYRVISDIMFLLFNKKLLGRRSGKEITTQICTSFDPGIAVAEQHLFGSDNPNAEPLSARSYASLLANCPRRRVGNRKVVYSISQGLFSEVLAAVNELSERSWILPPSFDVGGYTLGQLRKFSDSLAAFAQIHHSFNGAAPLQQIAVKDVCFNSLIKTRSKQKWIQELSRLSGLENQITEQIIDDLTFDPTLKDLGRGKADLFSMPFIPMGSDILSLSNRIAFVSSAERNFWKLLSIRRNSTLAGLSSDKETHQIEHIKRKLHNSFAHKDLVFLTRLNVRDETDLDLLLLDERDKFGIAVQLKWPYGPAYFREMKIVWSELNKGIEKMQITLPWLRGIPESLVQASNLSAEVLNEYRFEGMVLSKNSIGFGWGEYPADIPICSERFLQWALLDRQLNLRQFWNMASEYAFKPRDGEHFRLKTIKPQFGNITVSAPIAFNIVKAFDVANDIQWP